MKPRHNKPGAQSARARHQRSQRTLLASGIVAVVLIVGLSVWQRVHSQAPIVQALANTAAGGDLLPLTDPVKPLKGYHDMSLLPDHVPQPQPTPADGQYPIVSIPKTSFDFGMIPADPPVSYVFAIQNVGNQPMHLSNLVTSCSCTTAELSSSVIQPGQRADLQIIFDPDYHKTVGPVTRIAYVQTDDPTNPWVDVEIMADVRPGMTPTP